LTGDASPGRTNNAPQTRQKVKEAYDIHFAATIERAEKQIILAKYGRRLLNLLDDTPVVPGDIRQPFAQANEARQILADAEQDLQRWEPRLEPIHSNAGGLGTNLMPMEDRSTRATSEAPSAPEAASVSSPTETAHKPAAEAQGTHLEAAAA
jgi:hypothetical protein